MANCDLTFVVGKEGKLVGNLDAWTGLVAFTELLDLCVDKPGKKDEGGQTSQSLTNLDKAHVC